MHHSLRLWYFTLASLIKWKSFAVKCWFKLLISSTPSSSSTPARSLSLQSLGTRLSLPSSLPFEPGYKAMSPQQSPPWTRVQDWRSVGPYYKLRTDIFLYTITWLLRAFSLVVSFPLRDTHRFVKFTTDHVSGLVFLFLVYSQYTTNYNILKKNIKWIIMACVCCREFY